MTINDEDLIKMHEGLIYKLARTFYNADINDLYQVGVIGLLKAKKNFKTTENVKFSTYAYEYIYGEMYAYVESNRGIKVSRDILKLAKQIDKVRYYLTQIQGKETTLEEIAAYIERPVEHIYQALNAANRVISFEAKEETNRAVNEVIPDSKIKDPLEKLAIEESMENLNNAEKEIINLRYYQDLTQSETAKLLGMTQVMVSRYEKKGMEKMRSYWAA